MSTSVESTRNTIITAFKALHTANFPTIPVNYPNFLTVDLENYTGNYFVSVEISVGETIETAALSGGENDVKGRLSVSTIHKIGTGTAGSGPYTDMLKNYFQGNTISNIHYSSMKIAEISPYPGYVGRMNIISFRVLG